MVKLLVVGREGQLAHSLRDLSSGTTTALVALGRPDLEVTDARSVEAAFARERPDIVVNAAAYTAVDRAEREPALANAVNARGAESIATACSARSIPVIHISTDFVFDGMKDGLYREDDAARPIGAYGRSKLEGEQRVAAACRQHLILRTSWLHSPWGSNFPKTMLRLASERLSVGVVDDQRGTPTYAPDLATAVMAIITSVMADPAAISWGTYHVAGSGETTWCGFARQIFLSAAEHDLPIAEVTPITTADYPTLARRPANSRLDCSKLRQLFGLELPDWRIGVRDCVARLARLPR